MAAKYVKPSTPFVPFESDDWAQPTSAVDTSFLGSANLPQKTQAAPSTDWGSIGGAGIEAAGSTVGALAQVAGQKYQMDRAAEANAAGRMLSEKLAKMQLSANQDQFAREQNLRALLWALNANKGQISNTAAARDVRRGAIEGMDQLLAKVMLKRG